VTVVGIKTEVRKEQYWKALFGTKNTSLGMVMILLAPQAEQLLQGK
jgi:hypothetical protein